MDPLDLPPMAADEYERRKAAVKRYQRRRQQETASTIVVVLAAALATVSVIIGFDGIPGLLFAIFMAIVAQTWRDS